MTAPLRNGAKMSAGQPPSFAVIRLRPTDDVFALFRLLIQEGFQDVSFVNRLSDVDRHTAEGQTQTEGKLDPTESSDSATGGGGGQSVAPKTIFPPSLSALGLSQELFGPFAAAFGSVFPSPFGPFPSSLPYGLSSSAVDSLLKTATSASGSLFPSPADFHQSLASSTFPVDLRVLSSNISNGQLMGAVESAKSDAPVAISSSQRSSKKVDAVAKRIAMSTADSVGSPATPNSFASSADETVGSKPKEPVANGTPKLPSNMTIACNVRPRGRVTTGNSEPLYSVCQLCNNKIMCSRVSNLTNHVRRHAALKQFQCCYCEYTHNEMAKVRLHMLHNHKDKESQPIDNISGEMRSQWKLLLEKCFPEYCKRNPASLLSEQNGTAYSPISDNGVEPNPDGTETAEIRKGRQVKSEMPDEIPMKLAKLECLGDERLSQSNPSSERAYSSSEETEMNLLLADKEHFGPGPKSRFTQCSECLESVNVKARHRHVRVRHLPLQPFVCSACGIDFSELNKLQLHIKLKHTPHGEPADILTRDIEQHVETLVDICFGPRKSTDSPFQSELSDP